MFSYRVVIVTLFKGYKTQNFLSVGYNDNQLQITSQGRLENNVFSQHYENVWALYQIGY